MPDQKDAEQNLDKNKRDDATKKQDEISCDILYGIATTRKEGAVQLSFGLGS